MYKQEIKDRAKKLREQGFSYAYISKQIGAQKSTLSSWLQDVKFFPNETIKSTIENAQKKSIAFKRLDKAVSLREAGEYAEKTVGSLSKRDIFILGLGVYIGEGSKSHNIVRIVNSDPRIIRLAIKWFKGCFELTEANFKIRLHLYPDTKPEEAINYWVNELKVSKSVFHKPFVDRRVNKRKNRSGVLPYGTAHMSIVSNGDKKLGVLLHRKILATIDRVLSMRD